MEDKISHKSFNRIKAFMTNACDSNYVMEVCGFIGFDESEKRFVATIEKNQAEDPKSFFLINPAKFLQFKNKYSLLGIFHSHIVGDEQPSEFDLKMSEACCLPFIIYSINSKKIHIYEPHNKDYDVKIFARIKDKLS